MSPANAVQTLYIIFPISTLISCSYTAAIQLSSMRIACWIPKATNTHTICKIYCFSTTTMIARTLLNITLYKYCLSFFFTVVTLILILSMFFIYQLIHKKIALKRILKFTLKQLLHVSVQPPSSGSTLFEFAKVTVVKIIN